MTSHMSGMTSNVLGNWGSPMRAAGSARPKFPPDWKKLYEAESERWRIERLLSRHKPNVRARIERLNPVWKEGVRIRGWNPSAIREHGARMDCTTFRQFYEKWGVWPERKKSNKHQFFKSGRRRFVSWTLYMEGPTCDF